MYVQFPYKVPAPNALIGVTAVCSTPSAFGGREPQFRRIRTKVAQSRPKSASIGQIWPNLAQHGSESIEIGRHRASLAKTWPKDRKRPGVGRHRPGVGRIGPAPGQCRSKFGPMWPQHRLESAPHSLKCGRNRANFGRVRRHRPKLGGPKMAEKGFTLIEIARSWPEWTRVWPKQDELDQRWRTFGRNLSTSGAIWARFGRCRLKCVTHGRKT